VPAPQPSTAAWRHNMNERLCGPEVGLAEIKIKRAGPYKHCAGESPQGAARPHRCRSPCGQIETRLTTGAAPVIAAGRCGVDADGQLALCASLNGVDPSRLACPYGVLVPSP